MEYVKQERAGKKRENNRWPVTLWLAGWVGGRMRG